MSDDRYYVAKVRRRFFALERTDNPDEDKSVINPKTGKLGFDTLEEAEAHLASLRPQNSQKDR